MKMCNQCFELYDDHFKEHYCPKHRCEGDIVFIDSEISWPVSMINKELKKQKLPARTNFCCSGHLPNDVQAYIGFEFDDNCISDDIASDYMRDFIEEIINIPLKAMNKNLEECNLITVKHPYVAKFETLPDRIWQEFQVSKYRMFVNDFTFKYGRNLHAPLERCYAITSIQKIFKDFLIDCIASIKSAPKYLKIGF